ncbi:hypothetical protein MKX01_042701, partial [Papaver californicum]
TVLTRNAEENFGPWMIVDKRRKKLKRNGGGVATQKPKESNKGGANRFTAL